MSFAIQFDKVTKRYRKGEYGYESFRDTFRQILNGRKSNVQETIALDKVSFEVKEGDLFGLIGPNGSGKTTILKLIYRTTYPASGNILIRGRVGALIEIGSGLHPELTGKENVHFFGRLLGMGRKDVMRSFDGIVEFAEVGQFLDTPIKRYSAGMQLRLWFSIVSHLKPEVLLVDETLSVGDAAFQKKCTQKIHELISEGATVILVSHDLSLIEDLCNRVLFLVSGRMRNLGTAEESLRAYQEWIRGRSGEHIRSIGGGIQMAKDRAVVAPPGLRSEESTQK